MILAKCRSFIHCLFIRCPTKLVTIRLLIALGHSFLQTDDQHATTLVYDSHSVTEDHLITRLECLWGQFGKSLNKNLSVKNLMN